MPKMCPLTFATGVPGKTLAGKGVPRDCQEEKCAWWIGTECAVLNIAKKTRMS